jgi:alpha-D-ribose 1-methylphosphonate 5-triphosphate synthase subunit PhnL
MEIVAVGFSSMIQCPHWASGRCEIFFEAESLGRVEPAKAKARAAELLDPLNIPEKLWQLPPSTFSGGEQQRINIARGFAATHPILLLDEPTASLDRRNRAAVIEFIRERKRAGAALLGIFHDEVVKQQVADRGIDVTNFRA